VNPHGKCGGCKPSDALAVATLAATVLKSQKKKKKKKKSFFFLCFVFFSFTRNTARCKGGRKRRGTEKSKRGHFKILYIQNIEILIQSKCKLLKCSSAQRVQLKLDAKQKLLKTRRKKNTNQKNKKHQRNKKNEIKFERVIKMCEFQSVHSSATTCVVKPLNEGTCKKESYGEVDENSHIIGHIASTYLHMRHQRVVRLLRIIILVQLAHQTHTNSARQARNATTPNGLLKRDKEKIRKNRKKKQKIEICC
jgi:hypothetical protein